LKLITSGSKNAFHKEAVVTVTLLLSTNGDKEGQDVPFLSELFVQGGHTSLNFMETENFLKTPGIFLSVRKSF